MASRTELLKADIEKTKSELARRLAGLKIEAKAARRKAMARTTVIAGIVVAGVITLKLGRLLARHRSD